MATSYCVVLITAGSAKEADKISRALVSKRLAACVNIVPRIKSRYWWKGKIESSSEALLIAKTKKGLIKKLIAGVRETHSYTVPETIALPIVSGNPDYLLWINESV